MIKKAFGLAGTLLPILWLLWFSPFHGGQDSGSGPEASAAGALPVRPSGTDALIERLQRTRLLNGPEIHDQLNLTARPARARASPAWGGFLTHNPYKPPYRESVSSLTALRHPLPDNAEGYELDEAGTTFLFYGQEPVLRWYASRRSNTEVCGVRFVGSARVDYRLRTFPDEQSALGEGYVITHRHHCGTCSSLRDLAVYLAKPYLTSPVRTCALQLTASGIKPCLMEEVGFEEPCAETWTYNVQHSTRRCGVTCIKYHGLWNALTNDMGDAHADERGKLNPCLACDENRSGPGFRYAAGRTRRNSGLTSAIRRPAEEIYPVDHRLYFD